MLILGPVDTSCVSNVDRLVGLLLVTGKPERLHPRLLWALHEAIIDGAPHIVSGSSNRSRYGLRVQSDGNVGLAVEGVPAALMRLCQVGALTYVDIGVDSHFVVNQDHLTAQLRQLMRLPPPVAEIIYELGKRFATSSERAWKNWLKLRDGSDGSSVMSAKNDMRRQGPVAVNC